MPNQRFVNGVALAFLCLIAIPAHDAEAQQEPQSYGFKHRNSTHHTSSAAGNPTYAWLWISNYLNQLDSILYGNGGSLEALDVPTHPYAIKANQDAENFVQKHNSLGTPSDLDQLAVIEARLTAEAALGLLAAYPDLLLPQNQIELTHTLTTILDDLDV